MTGIPHIAVVKVWPSEAVGLIRRVNRMAKAPGVRIFVGIATSPLPLVAPMGRELIRAWQFASLYKARTGVSALASAVTLSHAVMRATPSEGHETMQNEVPPHSSAMTESSYVTGAAA